MRKAGIRIRFHDLRHTHLTILMGLNVHAKVASERAGHSSIGITMNTYSHVMPEMQQDAATKFDNLFREKIAQMAGSPLSRIHAAAEQDVKQPILTRPAKG